MYQYHCLNNIAEVGLKKFDGNYAQTDKMEDADAILVRSAVMHDMEFSDKLCVIGRAGAGVNNIQQRYCSYCWKSSKRLQPKSTGTEQPRQKEGFVPLNCRASLQ